MMSSFMYLMLTIMVLVSIAFFTLLERKILGYCQVRKGPNKVGALGIFQPFSDAIKLFSKEMNFMFYMNIYLHILSPILSILMMLLLWMIFYYKSEMTNLNLSVILFLCISSMSSYSILWGGWSSNSKYSLIGSYRGFAQVISYEVSMAMMLISLSIMWQSFNIKDMIMIQNNFMMIMSFSFLFLIWVIICLAETNRTPFDLSEGESELVSGFNIEYGSWLFAIIFISEYGMIMALSILTNYLFFGLYLKMNLFLFLIMMIMVLIRGTYVRYRYDKLMMMAWKVILPQTIIIFFLTFFLFFLFSSSFCINFWTSKSEESSGSEFFKLKSF
uniref:NADH-ubiquinone oxidoreductase chain 1 n=2 Tax=Bothriocroton concolor TaxID=65640 RepID=H9M729_BOTCN|nr:NADH dehydrogenase subunit 1 [Bothriocroton concolor]AET63046.1 NADH dehydrogenase subunit 1 [Bothriocroton concolor]